MSIKESKSSSIFIITLIYLLAAFFGGITFVLFSEVQIILRLFIADTIATIAVWLFSIVLKNSSIYDPYWSVAPIIVFTLFIFEQNVFGISVIPLLLAVWIWGIRLTLNWAFRFPNLLEQDWRYNQYKNNYPKIWHFINFFGIQLMPTIVVFLVMIPGIYIIIINQEPNTFTYLACMLCMGAACLQLISDNALHKFSRSNKGKVCNVSVWKYCRHPNYLGEISMWWGVYFMLLSVDASLWWTGIGAVINTMLFLFISIPLMEKRQISNKEDYIDYQKNTAKLVPFIHRSE